MDFDKCMSVNIDGTLNLLEGAKAVHSAKGGELVRFVFPSSIAAFGPQKEVDDTTKLSPESTYGTTKVMGELLINDFTRKGEGGSLTDTYCMYGLSRKGHRTTKHTQVG